MDLKKIEISNYRSIESLTIDIQPIDESRTFTLLGINESGKSSILGAISLMDSKSINYPQDFNDPNLEVSIAFTYNLSNEELKSLRSFLVENYSIEKKEVSKIEINEVTIKATYSPSLQPIKKITEDISFKNSIIEDLTFDESQQTLRIRALESEAELDLNDFFQKKLSDHFWHESHRVTFWKSDSKYLITDEINLAEFAASTNISIPLLNCFGLADISEDEIATVVGRLNNPGEIQNLEDLLSDRVTAHINKIWPEHPIKIKFKINNNKLTFLVEDKDVKYNVKTTNQRSDGFRQFISFLLTISAENHTEELRNSFLLIDEPETHLHPKAQINLKNELIKITKNKNNNIVLFATHSNYMIDKSNINRCYRVSKEKNRKTVIKKIEASNTSYSKVNYEVFDIPTTDYHNELYGYLEENFKEKLEGLDKTKKWYNDKTKKEEFVSLSKYIRNSIHHPENTKNLAFTEPELIKSIKILTKLQE